MAKKSVTFSFDDGVKQDVPFVELLNKYGMKCTFTVTIDSWTAHGKTVTITGGSLNVSGLPNSELNDGKGTQMKEIVINDSVTFTNMTWTVDSTLETFIYANGNKTKPVLNMDIITKVKEVRPKIIVCRFILFAIQIDFTVHD